MRERAADAAVREEREALLGERRTQKVVAERLQTGAIVGADGAVGVEIETREMCVARPGGGHPRRVGIPPHAQHGRAGLAAEEALAGNRRATERGEKWRVLGHGIARGAGILVGREPPAPEQALHPRDDRREEPRQLAVGGGGRALEAERAGCVGREDAVLC